MTGPVVELNLDDSLATYTLHHQMAWRRPTAAQRGLPPTFPKAPRQELAMAQVNPSALAPAFAGRHVPKPLPFDPAKDWEEVERRLVQATAARTEVHETREATWNPG
jgi:hypothetical protein